MINTNYKINEKNYLFGVLQKLGNRCNEMA